MKTLRENILAMHADRFSPDEIVIALGIELSEVLRVLREIMQ